MGNPATNPLDSNPHKNYALLVTFTWHLSTARYITNTSDMTIGADTFTASPALSVSLPRFSGDASEDLLTLSLPPTLTPGDVLASRSPAPIVYISVDEVDPEDSTTRRKLFKGQVVKVRTNPNGKSDVLKLSVAGPKYILNSIFLGLRAQTTCPWLFGDANDSPCGIDLDALKVTRTISTLDGAEMTISGTNPSSPADEKYWHRGSVVKDGVFIMIREATDTDLVLAKLPPDDWTVGDSLDVYPGCDKSLATCISRWDNEARFCGAGYSMPGYSPSLGSET